MLHAHIMSSPCFEEAELEDFSSECPINFLTFCSYLAGNSKISGQFEHLGGTNLLVSSFFHSNAHVFEFPANYQNKTQISVGHSEEKIN